MSDETSAKGGQNGGQSSDRSNGNGAGGNAPRQFSLRRLYLKDVSFEAPNSPVVFSEGTGEPEIKLNLRTSHRDLGDGSTEVVLHISAHALVGEKTMFLIELDQAGAFQISGFPAEEVRAILGIACPNTLFPYAREAISSMVQRGGFPPLVLQPIDFTLLFNQANAQQGSGAA
jgi:preprotein translocase subunit SecB